MTYDEKFWNDWLEKHKEFITYNQDGSIDVDKSVDIRGSNISKIIPKFNIVHGCFVISDNNLETFENSPKILLETETHWGSLYCFNNPIKSFKGLNADGIQSYIYLDLTFDKSVISIDKQIIKAIQRNDIKWLLLNNKNINLSGYEIISRYLKGELFV